MKCKLNFTKVFVFLAVCLFAGGTLWAQEKTVKGTVTDANGPASGVTVTVRGTSIGVTTGSDGSYSIRVPDNEAVLEFNYLGYEPVTTSVGDRSVVNVVMEEDTQLLDEVVVIGYGTVRRRDLTGSVASVRAKDIASVPVSNVAQAIQGKLVGVNVISQDGRPDGDVSLRVRGGTSISQGNDPLILIDGIPGSIKDVPSDMVSSIDVLKDASSTAIYGSRGANGVVLVTTKRGQEGKTSVSYNGYASWNTPTAYQDVLNPYDYLYLKWGMMDAYGDAAKTSLEKVFGLGAHAGNNSRGIDAYKDVPLYDMQKKVYNSSFSHNHDISIAGGNSNTKILFSLSYRDDEGMKINSYAKRAVANFKLDQKVFKNLNFNLDVRYTDRSSMSDGEGVTSGRGSVLSGAYRFRPISMDNMLGDRNAIADGPISGEDAAVMYDIFDPVSQLKNVENQTFNQGIRGTAGIGWSIVPGLLYRSELSLSRSYTQIKNWTGALKSKDYLEGWNEDYTEITGIKYAGDVDYRKNDRWNLRWTNTLNYEAQFGSDHRLTVLVGQEVTDSGGTDFRFTGNMYPKNFTKENAFAMIGQYDAPDAPSAVKNHTISSSITTPSRMLSFFGRANYSLKDKYLFTFTMRADGSSNFSPEHRWGYFPAAAIAWRVIDEPFMKDVSWLSDLKLRLSYGSVGNDLIDSSQWQYRWEAETDIKYMYVLNNNRQASYDLASAQMANRNLKWETTITRNLGIDYSILKGRVWGSIELYQNTTKDLLMRTELPGITGFTSTYANIGQTSNKGLEFTVNGLILQNKDWSITAGANIAFNKNRIDELAAGIQSSYGTSFLQSNIPNNDYMLVEGKSLGIVMGYKMDGKGYYTTDDFNYDAASGTYTLKDGVADFSNAFVYKSGGNVASGQQAYPGAPKFVDTDKSGTVDNQDLVEIGNMSPKHIGGFNVNVSYKNFDLGLNFNWSYGNEIYNATKLASLYQNIKGGGLFGNRLDIVKDSYKYHRIDNGQLIRVTDPSELDALNKDTKIASTLLQQGYVSDYGIEDGSFLRLNTLTLGYTLPKRWVDKVGISNLRLYGTIYNVCTITGYSGLDPEMNANPNMGKSYPTPGLDWGVYPRARQFVLGLNLNF